MEAAADSTEEWLRAVRYATRGECGAEGTDWLLKALAARPDRSTSVAGAYTRPLLSSTRAGF
jgi:hypothetical protein